MNEIWILAETKAGKVAPVSFELLAWARSLGGPDQIHVTAVLPGPASDPEELCYRGADAVMHGTGRRLEGYDASISAKFLASLLEGTRPTVFLAAATARGRTILPYLAAIEGLGLTADCTSLELDTSTGVLLQTRPAAGGNIMATIKTVRGLPQMSTVRPHSKQPLPRDESRPVKVRTCSFEAEALPDDGLNLMEERPFPESKGIADARLVVAGGKGLKKKENFAAVEVLAKQLGAEVGASREAVDRGWAEYPRQVGLSGRTISPDVYIALGISGAIQHLAGIQTAEKVVSVNTDPDAPIFAVSDLAIRGDLFDFIPALEKKLEGFSPAE